jgi:hypothetical protein
MSKAEELKMQPFDPSQGRKDKRVSLIQVARAVGRRIGTGKPDAKFPYQKHLQFTWAPVELCYINYGRQRYPEPKHISKLDRKWNIFCVTPLQARYSARENRYYIADGQQHGIEWILKYGEDSLVPVFFVDSEDENIESIQLLALNTDSEPMAKYFIHQQQVIMGDANAVALEDTVTQSDCTTGYKKRTAGVITHITDLWLARDHYGLPALAHVLSKMRTYWPTEKIATATMLGLLKVRELLVEAGVYSDDVFEEIVFANAEFFESSDRLHNDIKDEFEKAYPTNYRGMGVREKVASGILNVYAQRVGSTPVSPPFVISMPAIRASETASELVS